MQKIEVIVRITKDHCPPQEQTIFEAVWHKDSDSYLRAVSSKIGSIRPKIEDGKNHPQYIRTVSNLGYQFVPSLNTIL